MANEKHEPLEEAAEIVSAPFSVADVALISVALPVVTDRLPVDVVKVMSEP